MTPTVAERQTLACESERSLVMETPIMTAGVRASRTNNLNSFINVIAVSISFRQNVFDLLKECQAISFFLS